MAAIEIEGLRKEYRRLRGASLRALDGVDLTIASSGVHGFLGPNGSGKTTTIRCLLGLARPTGGRCRILGVDSWTEAWKVAGRFGALVELPGLTPDLSARRQLALLGRLAGIGPRRVEAVLERVGLADRANDKVRGYSQGMRQRLGIGVALLRDPELLVLDEPANGLDPAGIKAVRELTRSLGAEGRTVFVSSHILGEVQQTCDSVAILSRGRCVASGPVEEVLAAGQAAGMLVRLDDLDAGAAALTAAGLEVLRHDTYLRVALAPGEAATITRTLAGAGLYLTDLRPEPVDLEAVFLRLTGDQR